LTNSIVLKLKTYYNVPTLAGAPINPLILWAQMFLILYSLGAIVLNVLSRIIIWLETLILNNQQKTRVLSFYLFLEFNFSNPKRQFLHNEVFHPNSESTSPQQIHIKKISIDCVFPFKV